MEILILYVSANKWTELEINLSARISAGVAIDDYPCFSIFIIVILIDCEI